MVFSMLKNYFSTEFKDAITNTIDKHRDAQWSILQYALYEIVEHSRSATVELTLT